MRYRQCGNDTILMAEDGTTRRVRGMTHDGTRRDDIHIHLVRPEDDDDETPVTDRQLRAMVDRMGPNVRRTRISDDEEAYSGSVMNMRDLHFPRQTQRRRMNDVEAAHHAIKSNAQRVEGQQRRNDQFWDEQHRSRRGR